MAGNNSLGAPHDGTTSEHHRHHSSREESERLRVSFHEYDVGIFFLSWCVVFPILAALFHWGASPAALGWIKFFTICAVLVTVARQVTRNGAIIFGLVFAVFIMALVIINLVVFPVFVPLRGFIKLLHMGFSAGEAYGLALFGLGMVGYSTIKAWISGKWIVTPSHLEHINLGKSDNAYDRTTLPVDYDDFLKLCFGLCGTIVIRDVNGQIVLQRIGYVLFLPFRRGKMERIIRLRPVLEEERVSTEREDDRTSGGRS